MDVCCRKCNFYWNMKLLSDLAMKKSDGEGNWFLVLVILCILSRSDTFLELLATLLTGGLILHLKQVSVLLLVQ